MRLTQLCFNNHCWLVAALSAQNLMSRMDPVHILKVRAHAGIAGNEAADGFAAHTHDMEDSAAFFC